MGWPEKEAVIARSAPPPSPRPARSGTWSCWDSRAAVQWAQEPTGLRVQMPAEKLSDYAIALKIAFA